MATPNPHILEPGEDFVLIKPLGASGDADLFERFRREQIAAIYRAFGGAVRNTKGR